MLQVNEREAGSDWITFHREAVEDPRPLLEKIRSAGRRGGLAIRPKTPVEAVLDWVPECDMILVMTVEPGFSGQAFMPGPLEKIPAIRKAAEEASVELEIEVDGGIDLNTVETARAAGSTVFVAGSAIFRAPDVPAAIAGFRRVLEGGTP